MKKYIVVILILFWMGMRSGQEAFAQEKPAYQLFSANGHPVSYQQVLDSVIQADFLFWGEQHDSPIAHWLQLEMTQELYQHKKKELILGAEMFQADDQLVLNEYLQGKIPKKHFRKDVRLWPNYETDYAPLVKYAKEKELPFIATNVPRRYANKVYHEGRPYLEQLSTPARQYIVPLPYKVDTSLRTYRKIARMSRGHSGSSNMLQAQALKDATMAYFIKENWGEGQYFIHFNGTFHSNYKEGIVWYLQRSLPEAQIKTIATVHQSSMDSLEQRHRQKADFILCTPVNMTSTH